MSTKKFGIVAGIALALSVVISPVAACSLQDLSSCDNNGLMALIAQMLSGSTTTTTTTTTGTGTISGIPAGFQFTTNLKQGSTGNDVKYLQILLNSDPVTSLQNAGRETTYFGTMTKAAVIKFQAKYASEVLAPYGLTAGTGFFGTSSRAKANAILSSSTGYTFPAGCTSSSGFSTTTGQSCSGSGVTLPAGCTSTSGYSPTTGQSCSGGTTVPTGTSFSVRLASDNPASMTLVGGQATADLAHYTFSNGTGTAVNVTGVELTRIGVSADATLSNVYLFNGAARITDAGSVSAGKITFNAINGLFTVPANSTVTISAKADILAGSQGQTVGISLSGVTSNGTLADTVLPISGNVSTIALATLAGVQITGVQPAGNINIDPVTGVRIWESSFIVTTRNVQFTKLALKQINSISASDIANFKLLVDGAEVATVASLDANNMVTFTMDKILQTGTRNVKVLADVNGGSSRVIQMSLRNRGDIDVKDTQFGVNVGAVTTLPATFAPVTTGQQTVQSGAITTTIDNSVLPTTVSVNASNVLIAKYKMKASGEAVKVETMNIGFTPTIGLGGTPTLRNGKIMINGAQAGSTTSMALLAAGGTSYSVNYTFQPGVETTVEVYADIFNDGVLGAAIATGNAIAVTMVAPVAPATNATRQVSLTTVAVPTINQTAAGIQIGTGSAGLVRTPSYSNQTTVLPQAAYKVGSWTLTAGTAEDININNLRFNTANVNGASFTIGNMADMYVVYQVGTNAAVTSSATPTPAAQQDFPVSFSLPRTQTATVTLYSSLLANDRTTGVVVTPGHSVQSTLTVSGSGSQSGAAAVIAAAAGQIIVSNAATITVSRDASTPNAALVAQNNTVTSVAYKFVATNDAFTVSQLTFSINDPSAVSTVNLMEGTNVLQSRPASAVVTFNGFAAPITISATTPKILTVQLVLSGVGTGMGTDGANVTTDFVGAAGANLFRPSSGTTQGPDADNTVAGNPIFVYQTIPTISLVTLPTGTLQPGINAISKFQIATSGGTIGWKELQFTVAKTSTAAHISMLATGVSLWDVDNQIQVPTVNTPIALSGTGGNFIATDAGGTITVIADTEQVISGAKNYELRADVAYAGSAAVGDFINTRILNPSTAFSTPTDYTNAVLAKSVNAASGLAYTDTVADNLVGNTDVRLQATPQYTTVDVAADGVTVGHNAATATIVQAYGIANSFTMTLAESTATDNVIGALVFTTGVPGLTCTPYTNNNYTGAVGAATTFNQILSVECIGAGRQLRIGAITVTVDAGAVAGSGTLSIAITRAADYAINSAVIATSSDVGLVTVAYAVPSFVWSDGSAQNHAEATTDWNTGYLVKNLPTSTQNLIRQ